MKKEGRGRLVLLGGAFCLLAVTAALALSASAQACASGSFALNGYGVSWDNEGDGFNDSATVGGRWVDTAAPPSLVINATLEYQNASLITANTSVGPFDLGGFWFIYAILPMGLSNPEGNVILRATMDEGAGACDWANYSFYLYPPGRFQPMISALTGSASVDQDAPVVYQVQVGNSGNLPDTINLSANASPGWNASINPVNVTLGPGNVTTVNVTVRAPHNAAPLSSATTLVTARSATDEWVRRAYDPEGAANASVTLTTTIKAQMYLPELSSAAPTVTAPPGTVAHFSATLTNGGNNRDTFAVSASAAPIGWSIQIGPASFALDQGENASFAVNITTPTALTGLLVWAATLTATAGDGATTATLVIEAHVELADFALAPADISVAVAHPPAGSAVSVIVTVRNLGLATASDVVVSLADGSTNQTKTVTIGVSGSALATFSWTALPGTTTLTASADASHSIPEANEANNDASVQIVADTAPTAAVASATVSGTPGQAVSISAAGSSDSDGTVAAYYFDFGDGSNSDWVTTANVTHTYAAAGTYTVKVRVRDNAGAESANVTSTVTIAAPAAKGFLPGFDVALALAVVGGVGVAARGRRGR